MFKFYVTLIIFALFTKNDAAPLKFKFYYFAEPDFLNNNFEKVFNAVLPVFKQFFDRSLLNKNVNIESGEKDESSEVNAWPVALKTMPDILGMPQFSSMEPTEVLPRMKKTENEQSENTLESSASLPSNIFDILKPSIYKTSSEVPPEVLSSKKNTRNEQSENMLQSSTSLPNDIFQILKPLIYKKFPDIPPEALFSMKRATDEQSENVLQPSTGLPNDMFHLLKPLIHKSSPEVPSLLDVILSSANNHMSGPTLDEHDNLQVLQVPDLQSKLKKAFPQYSFDSEIFPTPGNLMGSENGLYPKYDKISSEHYHRILAHVVYNMVLEKGLLSTKHAMGLSDAIAKDIVNAVLDTKETDQEKYMLNISDSIQHMFSS